MEEKRRELEQFIRNATDEQLKNYIENVANKYISLDFVSNLKMELDK